MSDIIFSYVPSETNWLNPEWRRAKIVEPKRIAIMYVETFYLECTNAQKAKHAEMDHNSYIYWRDKLNLKGGIK